MTNRIDEIFSIPRLRRQWRADRKADMAEEKTPAQKLSAPGPMDVYGELEKLFEHRFPRGLNPGMELLLGELLECLLVRFPLQGAAGALASEEKAALDAAIGRTLDRIEDLFEALELGDAGSK